MKKKLLIFIMFPFILIGCGKVNISNESIENTNEIIDTSAQKEKAKKIDENLNTVEPILKDEFKEKEENLSTNKDFSTQKEETQEVVSKDEIREETKPSQVRTIPTSQEETSEVEMIIPQTEFTEDIKIESTIDRSLVNDDNIIINEENVPDYIEDYGRGNKNRD